MRTSTTGSYLNMDCETLLCSAEIAMLSTSVLNPRPRQARPWQTRPYAESLQDGGPLF